MASPSVRLSPDLHQKTRSTPRVVLYGKIITASPHSDKAEASPRYLASVSSVEKIIHLFQKILRPQSPQTALKATPILHSKDVIGKKHSKYLTKMRTLNSTCPTHVANYLHYLSTGAIAGIVADSVVIGVPLCLFLAWIDKLAILGWHELNLYLHKV